MGNILTMTDEEIESRLRNVSGKNITEEQIAATKTLLNVFSKYQHEIEETKTKQDEIEESEILQKMLDKYSPEELNEHALDIMNNIPPATIETFRQLFKSS